MLEVTTAERGALHQGLGHRAGPARRLSATSVAEPFFTTKSAEDGLGLGLTISQSILKRLSVPMRFSAKRDGGGTLCEVLPALARRGRAKKAEAAGEARALSELPADLRLGEQIERRTPECYAVIGRTV